MATRSALVNRQFNSPMKLYSPDNVADTMNHQAHILNYGDGIGYNQKMAAPGNIANSAVLRMLEESERGEKEDKLIEKAKPRKRLLRFEWPPKGPDNNNNNADEDDNNNNDDDCNDNYGSNGGNGGNGGNNRDKIVQGGRPRHHFFTTTIPIVTSAGLKRVAWPPPPDNLTNNVQQSVYPKEPVFNSPLSPSTNIDQQQRWSPNNSQPPVNEPTFQRTYQTAEPVFTPPPTVVTLRQSAPVSQAPPPIFESQPAAKRPSGSRMRGDEKWPPAENKAQAVAENEARKALAKGPACRPRAPKKDYSKFFAQHALTNNYPGYRAPPGTQHYVEEGTSNY